MLAVFSMAQLGDIHSMNAVKALLATGINGVAIVTFVVAKAVFWPDALVMIAGAAAGGYGAARIAHDLRAKGIAGHTAATAIAGASADDIERAREKADL